MVQQHVLTTISFSNHQPPTTPTINLSAKALAIAVRALYFVEAWILQEAPCPSLFQHPQRKMLQFFHPVNVPPCAWFPPKACRVRPGSMSGAKALAAPMLQRP
ncbi:hypothetical protein GCM10027276_24900 [Comamonas piscis]